MHVQHFSFLSKPKKTYSSLTPQLDTFIIEVCSANICHQLLRPTVTGFCSGQTSYLNMKVLTFTKDEKIAFKPLLTSEQKTE